ncbi:hypothetical protein [Photobacterium damselae]
MDIISWGLLALILFVLLLIRGELKILNANIRNGHYSAPNLNDKK